MNAAEKLAALRARMAALQLQALLVPMSDQYQNEYAPAPARRLEWLTGFTGSAGFVIVLAEQAAFFTDSRYTLQAQAQLPAELYTLHDTADKAPRDWLAATLPAESRIGYDPWLHSATALEQWRTALPKAEFVALADNPVDALWEDRPAPTLAPVVPHDVIYAGESSADKRQKLAEGLQKQQAQAVILTDPASTAWLLNIRGGDVPHTPLPLSFTILRADGTADWFVDSRKAKPELTAHLGNAVRVWAEADFIPALQTLGAAQAKVQIDPALTSAAIVTALEAAGAMLIRADDPCALPRACKNAVEQEGARAAHRRDAVALAAFFAWLSAQPPGTVTELQAEAELEARRKQQALFVEPSFATIAGSGPHGAIVHYRATAATDRALQSGELFLLDSGGQYRDGTTDVTRTVAIGTPAPAMREHYTRVVKGHIALASIRFPAGTAGADLDVLARQHLWAAGLDYGHGTGHGVGSFLSVHEGPQGISRRSKQALLPGMVLSNEPGLYRAGEYGIRFENLMLVTAAENLPGGTIPMLGFETLTLAPLDRNLLQLDLLTAPEREWINAYHQRIRAALDEQVDAVTAQWLQAATATLG